MDIGKQIGLEYGAPTRNAFGQALKELGAENPNIVVVDGDVGNSTRTQYFGKAFPDRFFNVGIAESNLIGVTSGLAASGKDALAASFAIFLMGNAYDQIRMSIAFPQLNAKLVGSHAGISIGEDGPSQMGIEDIALATSLPNFTVLVPADAVSTAALTRAMFQETGPVYMRTGRPRVPLIYDDGATFEIGKANLVRDGSDLTIVACGLMVAVALEAADALQTDGIETRILDMHTVKPLDDGALAEAARDTGAIVTVEEHLLNGGLGAAVTQSIARQHPVPVHCIGIDNTYAESGQPQELLQKYGLMPDHVQAAARQVIERKG